MQFAMPKPGYSGLGSTSLGVYAKTVFVLLRAAECIPLVKLIY